MKSSHAALVWHRLATCVMLGLIVTIMGCASTKVQPLSVYSSSEPLPRPERIVIYDFAVSANEVTLNSGPIARLHNLTSDMSQTEEELKVGQEVATALSEELVQRIRALGLPAERASSHQPLTHGALGIEGQFISIDEGNRFRRMIIGFGLGKEEVRTLVQVYVGMDGGQSIVQQFETTAESSKMPGMAPMMGVGAAARGAVGLATAAGVSGGLHTAGEIRESVEAEARRTADALVKRLAQFFAAQGWVPQETAQ
jgi:Domain of unknown function (DUF4410)